jgi:hypothetical protein
VRAERAVGALSIPPSFLLSRSLKGARQGFQHTYMSSCIARNLTNGEPESILGNMALATKAAKH